MAFENRRLTAKEQRERKGGNRLLEGRGRFDGEIRLSLRNLCRFAPLRWTSKANAIALREYLDCVRRCQLPISHQMVPENSTGFFGVRRYPPLAKNRPINLEKAVNHGGHSEHGGKTRIYAAFPDHPLGDYEERPETQDFRSVRRVRRG